MACTGKMTYTHYVTILEHRFLPYFNRYHPYKALFQHDGAAPHRAVLTKPFLANMNVDVMVWPARSPYLNPIENVWRYVAQDEYRNGTQHDSVEDLKVTIKKSMKNISTKFLRNLVLSVKKRAIAVLEKQGRYTCY